jgi:hypothetical protein
MPRKLSDIEVEEVSLVDAAANRKKFAIIKRRHDMDELIKLLKGMMDDAKDEDLEKAKEIPEEASKALKSALTTLNKYKGDFPGDVLDAIKILTKYASYGYGYPEKKGEELSKEAIEKLGARLSKATIEQLKMVKEVFGTLDFKGLKKAIEIIDKLIEGADIEKSAKYKGLPEDVRQRLLKQDDDEAARQRKAEQDSLAEIVKTALADGIKPIEARLDKVEKIKGIKKSIDGQDTDADADADKDKVAVDKWPSLSSPKE